MDPAELQGRAAIRWPPRIAKSNLRRLYESIPTGRLDEKRLDDIGISLFMRCQAILTVSEARRGRVLCPVCHRNGHSHYIQRLGHSLDEQLHCATCSWQITWADYQLSFQRRQLNEGGAGEAIRRYLTDYPACRTPWQKMLAIDLLIHQFHFSLREDPTRPTRAVCVNLIDGRLTDVVAFLNELSGHTSANPEMAKTHAQWSTLCDRTNDWYRSLSNRHPPKQ